MSLRTDSFDLGGLRLTSGEARRLELNVAIDPFVLGGERYTVEPVTASDDEAVAALIPVRLDVSRTTGEGYALRLRFEATLSGPCMRCLEPARPVFSVEAREVSQPGEGDELESPYVDDGVLDIRAWARDALHFTKHLGPVPGTQPTDAKTQVDQIKVSGGKFEHEQCVHEAINSGIRANYQRE